MSNLNSNENSAALLAAIERKIAEGKTMHQAQAEALAEKDLDCKDCD